MGFWEKLNMMNTVRDKKDRKIKIPDQILMWKKEEIWSDFRLIKEFGIFSVSSIIELFTIFKLFKISLSEGFNFKALSKYSIALGISFNL